MELLTPSSNNKIKIIYCMGSGRSGSTLLGIILGNHPKIVNVGELYTVHRIRESNFKCSCGERVEDCDFWAPVMNKWRSQCGESSVNRTLDKIKSIENFRSPLAWLKAIFYNSKRSVYYNEYLENIYAFYKIILEKSDKKAVVDISKNPLRAFVLMKHPNIDLRLIHLVRDGRAVAYSLHKSAKRGTTQRPVWRTALFWIIVNRQSNYVSKRVKNSTLIRYKDLVTKPEITMHKIAQMVDIDPKPLVEVINGQLAKEDSHIMEGNRIRKEKSIKLKLDTEWQEKLDPKEQRVFSKLAKKTLSNYGYR
jgi:hypothetical protein